MVARAAGEQREGLRTGTCRQPFGKLRLAACRKLEKNAEGEEIERRFVKYGSGGIDPTALPAEWHQ